MPILSGAWRILRRLLGGEARADARRAGDAQGGSGLNGLYGWLRDQVVENQRNNELVRQGEMRDERRAKRRSLSLLMKLLNPQQREEFRNFRYFHVTGGRSGNRYRIRIAAFANIDVLTPEGRVRHRLCAHPAGDVPVFDVMAAQMLHLQDPGSEQRFLRRANVHPPLPEEHLRSTSVRVA
ncbi:hypothetical protein [Noviherbaspirillum sp. UKPF54]|uniref:hypothetical protein n=1 Tax=Noviherbaspirillum sp. UKPF54 TaxID=2601898 RepID=UPI0011B14606|nr:hypothetical protein [Noviherbaspirillum sp. UKPF54]QDZ26761.1 hypothetical protein FAY22_01490 [Noviherbaspirillum sp. UKPF54]